MNQLAVLEHYREPHAAFKSPRNDLALAVPVRPCSRSRARARSNLERLPSETSSRRSTETPYNFNESTCNDLLVMNYLVRPNR